MQKLNKTKYSKRGFTLVELTIVMALVVIVSAITVSFSVMMKDLTADNRDEYQFMEQHDTLKEEISNWVAENDLKGSTFKVSADKTITVTLADGTVKTLRFSNGALYYSDSEQNKNVILAKELDEIDDISFSIQVKIQVKEEKRLLQCVTDHNNEDGQTIVTNLFVLSLRFGNMVGEVINET